MQLIGRWTQIARMFHLLQVVSAIRNHNYVCIYLIKLLYDEVLRLLILILIIVKSMLLRGGTSTSTIVVMSPVQIAV